MDLFIAKSFHAFPPDAVVGRLNTTMLSSCYVERLISVIVMLPSSCDFNRHIVLASLDVDRRAESHAL